MMSAPARADHAAGLLPPEDLAVAIEALAVEAPDGIMAPRGELQQTWHGLWF